MLSSGQCFVSPNGRFELLMQPDGNLVIYDCSVTPNAALWSSATALSPADPGFAMRTFYAYDALGNLLRVDQKGTAPSDSTQWRTRTFTYDSLSRLLTAVNPESGTITYSYDADGNLLQKTSPAPNQTGSATQTVSFCYDELHRVTGKGYGAQSCPLSTPIVTYAYDSGTNAKGKLTSLTDQAGTASYTYDILGRLATETRSLNGANNAAVSKTLSYDYNLDGSLKTLHYPSGAAVTYAPDSAGRILSAIDSASGINYVTGATYGPDSALTGFVSGNSGTFAGITNAFSYNKRLQPLAMSANAPSQTVFSIGYDFHLGNGTTGADNGNVWGITNYKDTTRSQTFTYDALNRLISAQNTGTDCSALVLQNKTKFWGNSYGYDAWGNLLNKSVTKCSAENFSVAALTNNQLSGYSYDAAGNMTHDLTGGLTYTFDPENRITGANGYTYTYDADGNRVKKSNASMGTLYWYMSPGIVAESDLSGNLQSEYVFFDGERVARHDLPSGSVAYYFSDHLKTASVVTDSSGNIKSESDFYPWGGELQITNNDSNHYKYGGHERDGETGNDYYGARYYSNGLGRFITPDWAAHATAVPYANFGNPQSLNLYAYVENNPTTMGDPDGHCPIPGLCAALEVLNGIVRDGGVKPYAKNLAIGTGKGLGALGVQAGRMIAAPNMYAGIASQAMPLPKAVTPSNETQAQASIVTQTVVPAVIGMAAGPAIGALESASMSTNTASSLTAGEIESGLANATLRTTQGEISAPVVNRYIDMSRAGSEAPPIKVDGNIIVDGNHRYAAGVLEGKPPATTSGTVAPSQAPKAQPFKNIKVTSTDYGNQ